MTEADSTDTTSAEPFGERLITPFRASLRRDIAGALGALPQGGP